MHDFLAALRFAAGKNPNPTAAIFDGRTMWSSLESGGRANYDGYQRPEDSWVHMAADTLGHLLALHVTPSDEQEREQVAVPAERAQEFSGETVEIAFVNQRYTGDEAAGYDILLVVSLPDAKKGFVRSPRWSVVERSYGCLARFRRLAHDYEQRNTIRKGLHYVASVSRCFRKLLHSSMVFIDTLLRARRHDSVVLPSAK